MHRIELKRVRVQIFETLRNRAPAVALISAENIYRAVPPRGGRVVLATIYNVLSLLAALPICGDCGQVRSLHIIAFANFDSRAGNAPNAEINRVWLIDVVLVLP